MNAILVIEDNDEIRENTAAILELSAYKTFTAENGKKGVEIALRENPDLIVCDITMPVLDGYGVLHLLNKNNKQIPFIFLSAKAERSDLRKGMELGADDYITKPFEESELLSAIETRLRKKNVITQEYQHNAAGIRSFMHDVKTSGLVDHLKDQYDIIVFRKKQNLYEENKRPKCVFYMVSGKVKIVKHNDEGKEYIEGFFADGDFIGYLPVIEDRNYADTAVVMEDAEILLLPKKDFLELLHAQPAVAQKFISLLTSNIRDHQERLLHLAYSSLRKRVAKGLLDIDAKFNKDNTSGKIGISRDDIAHYVGTATESLIRTLSDFKQEKLISIVDGKISILKSEKLQNLLY